MSETNVDDQAEFDKRSTDASATATANTSAAVLDPLSAALRARGAVEPLRRDALQALLRRRGTSFIATSVQTPSATERGSLVLSVTDDRPFLLDTILVAIRRGGHIPHTIDHPVLSPDQWAPVEPGCSGVSAIAVELDARLSPEALASLEDRIYRVLLAATTIVDQHAESLAVVEALWTALETPHPEPAALLRWLADDRMVLLGTAHHGLLDDGGFDTGTAGTGLLSPSASDGGPRSWIGPLGSDDHLDIDPPGLAALDVLRSGEPLAASAIASQSPVHRGARIQELLVADASTDGTFVGATRILYLLTHRAETEPASSVPLLRGRLNTALERANLASGSHDHKRMIALFDALPKEALLAVDVEELRSLLHDLMAIGPEEVLVHARRQNDLHSASIVVAIPRDRYVPALRDRIQALVAARYRTDDVLVQEVLGDEAHLQLHVAVYDPAGIRPVDERELHAAVSQMARTWDTSLREALVAAQGEEPGRLLAAHWGPRMPAQYRALVDPHTAVADVLALDDLHRSGEPSAVALRTEESPTGPVTRVALISRKVKAELSRVIMILEDLGLTVLEERPTRVGGGGEELWIQDFGVRGPGGQPLDLDRCGERVAAAVSAVWRGEAETDGLHRLIVTTELDHERLDILRAYRRYRSRIGSRYTERFQNEVIVSHPETTAALVRLFELRFDPAAPEQTEEQDAALVAEISAQIDAVESLDHDRILRNQLASIDATVRTNAYVPGRRALALKFRAADVPALPQPAPLWEVYVYAPHLEGVHLRGGAIARGGLRWSDREDFRTEVFGLMRAQMVKNAIIVPAGAKGGFRLRKPPIDPSQLPAAVKTAYVDYVEALLDLTDNRVEGEVVPPAHVRRRDSDDTYLVVAADKGTASFSDTANEVAHRRGFWLDDAFASGGSAGYDHKALGITAKGAWESVKRHFREREIDPEQEEITVVGIGDMSGDVFGNGLLRSRTIRLVGAYDHRHIFIDPSPEDPAASYAERLRLFQQPRSSWDDYDRALISTGGGVFARNVKSITLTDEIRECLGIDAAALPPTELIRALLRADVDLLWNGGIGTVVKASTESDADALDRSSDSIRVNGAELRATVVGEGGNLGFTHRGRIEFALAGGAINADFIDNSGGVECSDLEVNIKILLGEAVTRGHLDRPARDELLLEATGEVCRHVLKTSAAQARILTEEQRRSASRLSAYEELMVALEEDSGLIRSDHDLPTPDQMAERRTAGAGMTRPELAVLLSLAKIALTQQLLASPLVDDRALESDLLAYFPAPVVARFGDLAWEHPLRRELLAMLAAGAVVDIMGPSFASRRSLEFGASAPAVVRAFLIARDVCDAPALIAQIEALPGISPDTRWELAAIVQDAVRQVSRWYLRHDATGDEDLRSIVAAHSAAAEALVEGTAEVFADESAPVLERWAQAGVPREFGAVIARCQQLPFAPYLAGAASAANVEVVQLVLAVGALRKLLPLERLQYLIGTLPSGNRVARWANQALRDDYLSSVARLAGRSASEERDDAHAAVEHDLERREAGLRRLTMLVREAQMSQHTQVAGTTLAVRQLRELAG